MVKNNEEEIKQALIDRAKLWQDWYYHTLQKDTNRSEKEIEKIRSVIVDKIIRDYKIPNKRLHLLWRSFIDMGYIMALPNTLFEDLIFHHITPKDLITVSDYALLIGWIIISKAIEFLQKGTHEDHLLGSYFFVTAYEIKEHYRVGQTYTTIEKSHGEILESEKTLYETEFKAKELAKKKDLAHHAADIKHSKPGGSREKRAKIQEAWASGKYASRDICAEQECAALGMSFSTARKALIGTQEPIRP